MIFGITVIDFYAAVGHALRGRRDSQPPRQADRRRQETLGRPSGGRVMANTDAHQLAQMMLNVMGRVEACREVLIGTQAMGRRLFGDFTQSLYQKTRKDLLKDWYRSFDTEADRQLKWGPSVQAGAIMKMKILVMRSRECCQNCPVFNSRQQQAHQPFKCLAEDLWALNGQQAAPEQRQLPFRYGVSHQGDFHEL